MLPESYENPHTHCVPKALNLSSSNLYSYAGTVCSDAMKSGESGSDNPVNPGKPEGEITTTPTKVTDVIFCERKEWIGIEERSSA